MNNLVCFNDICTGDSGTGGFVEVGRNQIMKNGVFRRAEGFKNEFLQ